MSRSEDSWLFAHKGEEEDLEESLMYVSLSESDVSTILLTLGANSTKLQGSGNGNVQADHCFLHGNTSPTLGVSLDPPHKWSCFNPICSRGISIFSLISKAKGCRLREARAWLMQTLPSVQCSSDAASRFRRLGSDEAVDGPRFVLPRTALAAYALSANKNLGYRAIDYWGKCTRDQADEFRLGYDRLNHRLIFPVFHADGELAGLIGRGMLPATPKDKRWYNYDEGMFKKGQCLMGAELPLIDGAPIIVVEGPSDYVNIRAMGIPNVRATMGAQFSQWQVELLVSYRMPIVPMFDLDAAGIVARRKFIKVVKNRVRILGFKYPQSAFSDEGKADPGAIAHEDKAVLVQSFRLSSRMRSLHS